MSQKLCMMTPLIFRVDLFNELVENFGKRLKWSDLQAFVFVFQVRKAWAYLPMELLVIPSLPKSLIVRNRSNYSSVHEIMCSSRLGICLAHRLSQLSMCVLKLTYSRHMHTPACAMPSAHHTQTPRCPPGYRLEMKV